MAATSALLVLGAATAAWPAVRGWRAEAMREEGARQLAAGDVAASISTLRAAEALRPGAAGDQLALALVAGARAALDRGDLVAAARQLDEAGATTPGAAARRAELALARGDLDRAATFALASAPIEPDVATRVARALLERATARAAASPAAAAADLQAALRLDPAADDAHPAEVVAFAHGGVDDWSALEAALALAPDDVAADAWGVLVQRCGARHRSERLREAAERSLARARSPLRRAHAWYYLGRRDEVRSTIAPLVDDPQVGVAAQVLLAALRSDEFNESGNTDERRRELAALFGELLARDPSSVRAHLGRGVALAELGDARGRDHLARACELARWHERPRALQLAGYAALRLGDDPAALRAFDEALAADPGEVEARKQRGIVRHAMGDRAGARADLERVVADVPTYTDLQLWGLLVELRAWAHDVAGTRAAGDRLRALYRDTPAVRTFVATALVEAGDLRGGEALVAGLPEDTRLPVNLRATVACVRARIRAELQDADGALADALLSVSLAPDEVAPQVALAFARLAAGQAEAGLELAQRAIDRARAADALASARVARAWALVALEADLDRAEEDASSGVDVSSAPSTIALAVRALARRARGDLDGARADARAVLARLGETCPEAWTVRVAREVLSPP